MLKPADLKMQKYTKHLHHHIKYIGTSLNKTCIITLKAQKKWDDVLPITHQTILCHMIVSWYVCIQTNLFTAYINQ